MTNEDKLILAIEDAKQAMHKMDVIRRPLIIFLHPDDAEAIKADLPRLEKEFVIQVTSCVEKGKVICMRREDYDPLGELINRNRGCDNADS